MKTKRTKDSELEVIGKAALKAAKKALGPSEYDSITGAGYTAYALVFAALQVTDQDEGLFERMLAKAKADFERGYHHTSEMHIEEELS
jgi:hypothetical protein